MAAAVVAGSAILRLFFGADYAAHGAVFVWVMGAGLVSYAGAVIGCAANATRRFGRLLVPYALTTAVAAASALVLVPAAGLAGAAWALLATSAAGLLLPLPILRAKGAQA
jgi:O-antigen/teichoic acid export membrane protein